MFDTIVLLTGPAEQVALASVLRVHRRELTICPVTSSEQLAALDADVLRRARLIAFSSAVIVTPEVLTALGYGAYNFHPGPPDYPGWAPSHFALYDGATEFGATLHAMNESVDAGPIVEARRFPIPADIGVSGLEGLAYAHLAQMYWIFAEQLATEAAPLPAQSLSWGPRKNTRRAYQAICDIPLDITRAEFERRMRVFGSQHFGVAPTIHLHGVEFRAVMPDAR